MRLPWTGTALLVLALASPAQVSRQGDHYLLRVKWQKGHSYTYTISTKVTVPGAREPIGQVSSYVMKVKDVRNGVATLEYQFRNVQGMSDKVETAKVDSHGKTVSGDSPATELAGLPDRPLRIGETWSNTTTTESLMGKMTIRNALTLKKIDTVGGKKVAVLSLAMKLDGAKVKGTGSGTVYVDVADGMTVRADMEQRLTVPTTDKRGVAAKQVLPVTVTIRRK